jgi:hypothetical protein
MLLMQGGRCATCPQIAAKSKRRLHVDHDHTCCPGTESCGRCIRGLLCGSCNAALGHARDDVTRLRSLAAYVGSYGRKAPRTTAVAPDVAAA